PAMGIGATTCFCKNGCDGSGDGPCAAAARALLASIQPSLDTTNPLVLVNETAGYGRFSAIVRDAAIALAAPTSNCTVNVCPGQRETCDRRRGGRYLRRARAASMGRGGGAAHGSGSWFRRLAATC